jgi:RHS repeat-associated protein
VVISPSSGGNVLWGLADHLGTIRDIADLNESTGSTAITNHRRFNSFGALVSESNAAVDLLFAYTGKQFDETTGLQHNWFRWYDPALGQWLSEDPLGFAAGDENVRRYVGNGVVDSIDPTGLYSRPEDTPEYYWGKAEELLNALIKSGTITQAEGDLRKLIVNAALYHRMRFNSTQTPELTHWHLDNATGYYAINPGLGIDGVLRRVFGTANTGTHTGCENAARLIFLVAFAQSALNNGTQSTFNSRFDNMALPQLFGDFSNDLQKYQFNADGIDVSTLTPGDRVRMDNPLKNTAGTVDGGEGSNVIYIGEIDNEHLFAHVTVGQYPSGEWERRVETLSQLQTTVRAYSPEGASAALPSYRFVERWSPSILESITVPNGR